MVSSLLQQEEQMMSRARALSLTGERFGRWTVLSMAHTNERGEIFWDCRCDCGKERPVRAGTLMAGTSTSCGCYHLDAVSSHRMTNTPAWLSWKSMLRRCENPNSPDYSRYGARGIRVCAEWHEFAGFLASMGERPRGTSLERADVHGDYAPDNCRWATATQQQRNKQNAQRLTLNGVTKNVHDWAEELGVPVSTLTSRLSLGWSEEATLTTPVRAKRPARKAL